MFLSKEEGGHGLIHIESRVATFRLQFVQKFLLGPKDVVWRDVTSCILRRTNNLGLDAALCLMDFKFFNPCGLPPFKKKLFKAWNCFKRKRLEPASSIHWLLEEPLINGARMDIEDSTTPGLTNMLCTNGAVTLRSLVD